MNITAKDIRNVAVIGHSGEGKTTLCEAMLFNGGMIDRMGKTEDGTTVMDYDELEKLKKLSVNTAVAYLIWKGVKINLLDLPGFYDFEGERHEGLAACGAAILVIGANGVLPIGAESVVDYCLKLNKPLVIFINGMDKANADYTGTVNAMREKYSGKLAPIQIPIIADGKMTGYVNSIQERAYKFSTQGPQEIPVPAELKKYMEEMQASLMESAAENDEILLDKYFQDGKLSKDDTVHGIRKGILTGSVIPVMAGSALQNRGVINLLDEIVRYMPNANERRNALATDLLADELISVECEENAPFAAQVFKTVYDSYSGKMNYIKVFRGKLKAGSTVFNPNTQTEERIGQIFILRGKKTETVTELTAGDVGAVNKLTNTDTNHTLCAIGTSIQFDPIRFPRPTLSLAVKPVNKGDEDKMFSGFNKMREEDYTFAVEKRADTGELVLSGQGEVHLEVLAKKLKSRYGIGVTLSEPKIPYRETIRAVANAEGKHKKQSGGHGQYGHVKMKFEPSGSLEEPYVFEQMVVGGAVPKNFFPAVEKGLQESVLSGPLAAYPVVGVKAILYDGSYHPVDSSEMAFKMATIQAFKKGFMEAKPILLEPIVSLKVTVPDAYTGDVMGDLNKRRGRVLGMNPSADGKQVIEADIPMSCLHGYCTDLRSMTGGRGAYEYQFSRYEQAPGDVQEKEVAARAAKADDSEE